MSKLDGPSDPVVSAEKVRLLEEKVAAYDKDIVDVLAEIELVKQEEEVILKEFNDELDRFYADIQGSRLEIQDEIIRTEDIIQKDRDGMLQVCDKELEVIKEKLDIMKEMHDERVHEIAAGYAVVSVSSVPCCERIQNKLLHWFTLGVSTIIAPKPVLSLFSGFVRGSFGCCKSATVKKSTRGFVRKKDT